MLTDVLTDADRYTDKFFILENISFPPSVSDKPC